MVIHNSEAFNLLRNFESGFENSKVFFVSNLVEFYSQEVLRFVDSTCLDIAKVCFDSVKLVAQETIVALKNSSKVVAVPHFQKIVFPDEDKKPLLKH
jgi:hypothetical protein